MVWAKSIGPKLYLKSGNLVKIDPLANKKQEVNFMSYSINGVMTITELGPTGTEYKVRKIDVRG